MKNKNKNEIPQRLFKELFYRKGFQYDNMFDWTVLNLQNERGRAGGGAERPASAPRADDPREAVAYGGAAAGATVPRAAGEGVTAGATGEGGEGGCD